MTRHIPAALLQLVRDRAAGVCEYCLLPQLAQEATFPIDPIVPRAAHSSDVDPKLEKSGSFSSLAIARTQASYERQAQCCAADLKLLETVNGLLA
jgi:hypothetical protein